MSAFAVLSTYFGSIRGGFLRPNIGHSVKWLSLSCYTVQSSREPRLQSLHEARRDAASRSQVRLSFGSPVDSQKKTLLKQSIRDDDKDPYYECWAANSWSVNPHGDVAIDSILQKLHSPAPQSFHVIQRALLLSNETNLSSQDVFEMLSYLLKDECQFAMRNRPSTHWIPGVDWNILSETKQEPADDDWKRIPMQSNNYTSTMRIADHILSLVLDASEAQQPVDQAEIDRQANLLEKRLNLTLGTDIRGRTSADAAFTLALAGVKKEYIYQTMAKISLLEMERVKKRSSRRAKDVIHVVEKLAASGLKGADVKAIYKLAAECLALKDAKQDSVETLNKNPQKFDLLSPRPLMWLWRFSARQPKARETRSSVAETRHTPMLIVPYSMDRVKRFDDISRPLVIDVGCGMGVSLLGLASLSRQQTRSLATAKLLKDRDWNDCTYLGGDLSQLAVRFGRGITDRWRLDDRLQFVCAPADRFLREVESVYPNQVALVLIQFPTPYRLANKQDGNNQLPSNAESGFMVSRAVMQQIANLLAKSGGRLLLQSNCEDVAITMRDTALKCGLKCIPSSQPVTRLTDKGRLPQRTEEWILLGGERAIGPEWSEAPLLPSRCATETEIACEIKRTPVHRCLLEMSTDTVAGS